MITDENDFLRKCSEQLDPVECISTREGSIVVEVRGTTAQINSAKQSITQDGFDLPGYDPMPYDGEYQAKDEDSKDELFGFFEVDLPFGLKPEHAYAAMGVVLMFICCFCYCTYQSCCKKKDKLKFVDCTEDYNTHDMELGRLSAANNSSWAYQSTSGDELQAWGLPNSAAYNSSNLQLGNQLQSHTLRE